MRKSLLICLLLVGSTHAAEPTFEKDVLPILRANCLGCHGGLRQRAGLDLRSLESVLKGSKSGPVILSKDAEKSLLWRKIAADEMPKEAAKLSAHDKKIIRAWIESGASKLPPEPTIAVQDKPRDPKAVAEMIDKEIDKALANAKVATAPLASDAEFFRRAHLDIVGRIPTPEDVKAFLADQKPNKREAAVDALLARPEFGKHFGMTWHHLLEPLNSEGKRDYNDKLLDWLKDSLNAGQPISKTLGDVLTAQGDVKKDFKSSFLIGRGDPGPAGLQTGRLFLGINLECAECHNHPHTHWRQKEDYWGIAAFFGQTSFKNSLSEKKTPPKPGIAIPKTALTAAGTFVPPNYPGAPSRVDAQQGNRKGLSDWLASRQNPYFARNIANRLWANFFGRGLVNPLDDLRPDNPATHPATLSLLAAELHAADHDIRHLIRCICRTRAYGRSTLGAEGQVSRPELYDRMPLRTVTPEVLYDSLCVAFGQEHLRGLPKRTLRPGQKADASLGHSPRFAFINRFPFADEPPSPLDYDHGELQVLLLVNLLDGNCEPNRFKAILDAQPPNIVDELYLATLSRLPIESERKTIAKYLSSQGDSRQAYLSVYWSLINASEFVFNH